EVTPFELTPAARVRLDLYRAYLYLILLVENGPRQYPEAEYARIRDKSIASLGEVLDRLVALAPETLAPFVALPAARAAQRVGHAQVGGGRRVAAAGERAVDRAARQDRRVVAGEPDGAAQLGGDDLQPGGAVGAERAVEAGAQQVHGLGAGRAERAGDPAAGGDERRALPDHDGPGDAGADEAGDAAGDGQRAAVLAGDRAGARGRRGDRGDRELPRLAVVAGGVDRAVLDGVPAARQLAVDQVVDDGALLAERPRQFGGGGP